MFNSNKIYLKITWEIGKWSPNITYTIREPDGTRVELQSSEGEKDLSVKVDNELASSEHITATTGLQLQKPTE